MAQRQAAPPAPLHWDDFPRSQTLARVGMALLGASVGVACLLSGLDVVSAIILTAISLAGMEQSTRIVGDTRWIQAYTGACLTGLLSALVAGLVSPLAGILIGCVAVTTAVRLVIAGLAAAR